MGPSGSYSPFPCLVTRTDRNPPIPKNGIFALYAEPRDTSDSGGRQGTIPSHAPSPILSRLPLSAPPTLPRCPHISICPLSGAAIPLVPIVSPPSWRASGSWRRPSAGRQLAARRPHAGMATCSGEATCSKTAGEQGTTGAAAVSSSATSSEGMVHLVLLLAANEQ